MATEIMLTPEASTLISQWENAKKNEDGWNAIRKQAEEKLIEIYGSQFDEIVDSLGDTDNLTTSVVLGTLKVTVGEDMKYEQAGAVSFLQSYPAMVNILFKQEYKADTRGVLRKIKGADMMGTDLKAILTFKRKRPSFALKS